MATTPVILPGKFHGQRNLVNYVVHEVVKSQTRLCTHHLSCYVADLIKDKRLILSIYLPVVKELNFALKTSSGDKCRPFVLSFFLASLCFSLLSVLVLNCSVLGECTSLHIGLCALLLLWYLPFLGIISYPMLLSFKPCLTPVEIYFLLVQWQSTAFLDTACSLGHY